MNAKFSDERLLNTQWRQNREIQATESGSMSRRGFFDSLVRQQARVMSNNPRTKILLMVSTFVVSFFSQVTLSYPWYCFAIKGTAFHSASFLLLLECLPFAWPYAIAGYIYGRLSTTSRQLGWIIALGCVGGVLYSRLVHAQWPDPTSFADRIGFYIRFIFPLFFSGAGFLCALFQKKRVEMIAWLLRGSLHSRS